MILGGAGFIGNALTKNFANQGTEVIVVDNFSFGRRVCDHANITYIDIDVNKIHELKKKYAPDAIYHFAEYSRVEQSFTEIDFTLHNNIGSILNILSFAKEKHAKLIYAGSSTKFGDNGKNKTESPYALSKSINSELVKSYCEWNDVPYAIVYFYNAYGPGETNNGKYATVIGRFLKLLKEGASELPVTQPGTQMRNFTHIDDIVTALDLVGRYAEGDLFGIGSDRAYSILDIVSALGVQPKFTDGKRGNRMSAELLTEKTKALGWAPTKDLMKYLKDEIKKY
jgi:UDP-glucose 4-epimerase